MKSTLVNLNAFAIALSALFCMSVQAQQAPLSPFADIAQARQIYGPKISPEALQGKIVFVEFWGTYCGPCRQSMPHLQQMYNQFGQTGLFCMIGNHVQQYSSDTEAFLKKTGVTFPVFQHLNLPINRRISAIPRAFLFDASGKIVAEGHPKEVVNKIPALIEEASSTKKSETLQASNSLSASDKLFPRINKSDLDKYPKTAIAMISPRQENYKSLQNTVLQLNRNSAPSTVLTARATPSDVKAKRLIELSKSKPAKTYTSLAKLNRTKKDMNKNPLFADVFQTLSADKRVKDLSAILVKTADLESQEKQMTPDEVKAEAQSLFLSLKAFYYGNDLSPALKKETCDAARKLKEKYGCSGKVKN